MPLSQMFLPLLLAGALSDAPQDKAALQAGSVLFSADGLDHVMIWRRDVDAATAVLAVKLGFTLRPGAGYPDGVAKHLVSFRDKSNLQLLYFNQPRDKLSGAALKAYQFTELNGGGARGFVVRVDNVETLSAHLTSRGFELNDPSPSGVRFKEPALWSADMFFVRFDRPPVTPERAGDIAALERHPNGATGISAVWLLSQSVKEQSESLQRMGFRSAGSVEVPTINAKGLRFEAAEEAIVLLEPNGAGPAAQALAKRGAHLYGVSIGVEDLGRAQRIVEQGTGLILTRYSGRSGEAFVAPMQDQLGIAVEFHQNR